MPLKDNLEIKSKKLLFVEGADEFNFFDKLLNHIDLHDVQTIVTGGKTRFSSDDGFEAITALPGYENVTALAVIRDADSDANNAFRSVANTLEKFKLPVPENAGMFFQGETKKVGIYIIPDGTAPGMLEDLCLEIVKEEPVMHCVEQYIACVRKNADRKQFPKNEKKAKIQAYLAGMHEIVNSLGLGAQKGYWDFNHPSLNKLKAFLENLR